MGDGVCALYYVNMLMNKFCDVDFLRLSCPAVSYSYYCDWMIVFYTNHNIRQDGRIDEQKEDKLVRLLHELLCLPGKPPKLWFWADMGDSVDGSWYVNILCLRMYLINQHRPTDQYKFVSALATACALSQSYNAKADAFVPIVYNVGAGENIRVRCSGVSVA